MAFCRNFSAVTYVFVSELQKVDVTWQQFFLFFFFKQVTCLLYATAMLVVFIYYGVHSTIFHDTDATLSL